jgi:hypothetical protein
MTTQARELSKRADRPYYYEEQPEEQPQKKLSDYFKEKGGKNGT